MLAEKFAADAPLPQVGSIGYLRGTAQRARVLRRNARHSPVAERTCLVELFERIGCTWQKVLGSSGNAEVEERDLYPTEEAAAHCGRKQRARTRQQRRR